MLEVRRARQEDKAGIRALWALCFGDTEQFMDWFFEARFSPAFSCCLLEDGAIMSALQSVPLHARIRGHIVPVSMLAGVSTHPERNGRGYMKKIFLEYMQLVREMEIPFAIHTPAHLPTFFSRGHFPATDTLRCTIEQAAWDTWPLGVETHSMVEGLAPLQACYHIHTQRYSGCIARTLADFQFKFRDYASDGAACIVRREGQRVLGYCVYYALEDKLHAEECIAANAQTLQLLLEALCHEARGRTVVCKLAPDMRVSMAGAKLEVRPQGVMGIANVQTALRAILGDARFVFEITDETVPQNAGVFDGGGAPSSKTPQLQLPAGRLGQFLCGYRSLQDIVQAGEGAAKDADALQALDTAYPCMPCFVVDEY